MIRRAILYLASPALLLSACAPALQDAPPGAAVVPPADWRTSIGVAGPVETHWWESFGDPQLSRIVEQARRNNPDVQIAAACMYRIT